MNMPNDPIMLLSCINMLLRDKYSSFDELCRGEDIDSKTILDKLAKVDYKYNSDSNQFR